VHDVDEWGMPLTQGVPLKPLDHNQTTRGKQEALGADGMLARDLEIEQLLFSKAEASGINFKDYDNIPVTTTGKDIPPCIEKFSVLKLAPPIMNALALAKYETPTPIQKHALPVILAGRDVKASAQV
jgi:ATP-dependent RNA helicase DDX3X